MTALLGSLLRYARSYAVRRIVRKKKLASASVENPYSLLAPEHNQTVLLVSMLGSPSAKISSMIAEAQRKLSHFDRHVFLVSCDNLAEATQDGAVVEQLPGLLETASAADDGQLKRYVLARYTQVLRKWQPDFVFTYGLTPELYCVDLVRRHRENAPVEF